MDDSEILLTPATPPVKSLRELRKTYIARARRNDVLRAGRATAPAAATARQLGAEWGVGVGLHFELLKWLRWLSLFMAICAIPFLVVIGCSVFTDAAHMDDHTYGVKKYPATKVHSLTFAAIVDDSVDNGTLQYINTELGSTWKGPMRKSTFLIWISLIDAGALLFFVLGLAALWYHLRRFAEGLDAVTLEASAYTVLVRGLPEDADAAQVGEHFSRYGEVMDVVLVTDRLSATLSHCGRAARLQQRRAMVLDASVVDNKHDHLDKLSQLDEKLAGIAEDIRGVAERRQCVRAAFVTFNSENERRACTAHCPNSWLTSLVQPRHQRFRERRRFWVRRAAAPEDYQFEHLAASEWQLVARELAVNLVTLLLVLVCAAAITKLTDISNREGATVKWFWDYLQADATSALNIYGRDTNPSLPPAARLSSSAAMPPPPSPVPDAEAERLQAFCTAQLAGGCSAQMAERFNGSVSLAWGVAPLWANATSRLLLERPARAALKACALGTTARGSDACGLQMCLPCLCLGMSQAVTAPGADEGGVGSVAWASEALTTCPAYINQLDVRTWGVRLSISAVVAALNAAIKWILQGLVRHGGRHWTHTARERSYALQCFVAMLVNTVVVLLLVNCAALGRLARDSQDASWVRYFVRYGSYGDFSADWYENVGLSITILMLLNLVSPLLNMAIDWAWQLALRCRLRFCVAWPLQADYDTAWARPRFTLEQRTAGKQQGFILRGQDLLLNATLAMLFGTGMPLLYLVFFAYLMVAEAADRWALTKLTGGAPRYSKGLLRLVLGLLPWLAVAHLAFGLWMHTYFKVVPPEDGSDVSQLGVAAVRATNARLSAASQDLSALQRSSVWRRITQPNGLAQLLLFAALTLWLLVARFFVSRLLSCLARAADRLCCPTAARAMRLQLNRDARLQLNAVPYAEALVRRELRGTPTYRLAHHPHYLQYFAASGLNRAVGVAALVVAAANGGTGRHVYTRLCGGGLVKPEDSAGVLSSPGDVAGMVRGPDVWELLAAEEQAERQGPDGGSNPPVGEVQVLEDGQVVVAIVVDGPAPVAEGATHQNGGDAALPMPPPPPVVAPPGLTGPATAACIVRASHGNLRIELPVDPPLSARSMTPREGHAAPAATGAAVAVTASAVAVVAEEQEEAEVRNESAEESATAPHMALTVLEEEGDGTAADTASAATRAELLMGQAAEPPA
ncbi:hypothetical protein GPECTOR_61g845 [Gonium pectorale]|uniref:CSC1/OSCA1-like cytosolic domain-containing protein n=1 Tax=Gonium pectorale TaxID=33097 RepID=A0A150G4V7_GONPE|nr:hypothetical protein GPECTOR_61g845 [Gonium pectorale]|eukprot:KXZ44892.1 hypothetical protein GPECTOR_61g845 [Gonium pectorale]